MKTLATTIGAFLLATTTAHAGLSGVADYSFELSSNTAVLGETITVTVVTDVSPEESPFYALASSVFDVNIADVPGGGTIAARAVTPSFIEGGDLGTLSGNNILGASAGQLPVWLDPFIETGTHNELFTFEYTVNDATPRVVAFDLSNILTDVYTGPGVFDPLASYSGTTEMAFLQVTGVPAPGAMALLAAAGVVSGRRRRRDEA